MPDSISKRHPLTGLLTAVLLIAIFFFGKPVLMPLALAFLLSFLLSPIVNLLHRCRLPRPLAVMLVTFFVFTFIGVVGWVIGRELSSLASSLPNYKDNIRDRIVAFRGKNQGGVMEKLQDIKTTIEESSAAPLPVPPDPEFVGPLPVPAATSTDQPIPSPRDSSSARDGPSDLMGGALGTVGEILSYGATIIVFVIFMLLRQQELRNRLMRLAGFRHVTVVTRAMDETSERVGRYLLMQAAINGSYGLVLATGLYFIGLPYVVLWGVLAALLRFIPYLGPLAAAVLPCALSLAFFNVHDWQHPLMVMALIGFLELVTNMVLEPILYGHSVGVAEFPLLVSIVFWTWLWGGIGLIMATPLTVCFLVIARHVPSLEWVEILMGEHPKVKPYMVLYQRLLAGDEAEAEDFILDQLKTKTPLEVVDETILPAIALAKRECVHERLTSTEEQEMHDKVIRVMGQTLPPPEAPEPNPDSSPPLVLGWALGGPADDAALQCFCHVLPRGIRFEVIPAQQLSGEFITAVEEQKPAAIFISATPPATYDTTRLHLRRLRQKFPKLRIYVGRWGVPKDLVKASPLVESGATAVYARLGDAQETLVALVREAAAVDEMSNAQPNSHPAPPPAATDPGAMA